jgi:hypothetical protein
MVRLFGAGLAETGTDAVWVFTASQEVGNFLDSMNIDRHVLWRDKVSEGDEAPAEFCYVDVVDRGPDSVLHIPVSSMPVSSFLSSVLFFNRLHFDSY